jgi:hypothetical protein
MRPTSYFPVIMVDAVKPVAAFYLTHFGFKSLFTSDWYVHVQSEANPVVNFGILQANHESIPASKRGVTGGALLSFEVENVDAEYARLKAAGLPVTPHSANLGLVTLFTMHLLRAIEGAGKYLEAASRRDILPLPQAKSHQSRHPPIARRSGQ